MLMKKKTKNKEKTKTTFQINNPFSLFLCQVMPLKVGDLVRPICPVPEQRRVWVTTPGNPGYNQDMEADAGKLGVIVRIRPIDIGKPHLRYEVFIEPSKTLWMYLEEWLVVVPRDKCAESAEEIATLFKEAGIPDPQAPHVSSAIAVMKAGDKVRVKMECPSRNDTPYFVPPAILCGTVVTIVCIDYDNTVRLTKSDGTVYDGWVHKDWLEPVQEAAAPVLKVGDIVRVKTECPERRGMMFTAPSSLKGKNVKVAGIDTRDNTLRVTCPPSADVSPWIHRDWFEPIPPVTFDSVKIGDFLRRKDCAGSGHMINALETRGAICHVVAKDDRDNTLRCRHVPKDATSFAAFIEWFDPADMERLDAEEEAAAALIHDAEKHFITLIGLKRKREEAGKK